MPDLRDREESQRSPWTEQVPEWCDHLLMESKVDLNCLNMMGIEHSALGNSF